MNITGELIITVIALGINLITIIKFANVLERRLTTLEVLISESVKPRIEKLEAMFEIVFARSTDGAIRKKDFEEFVKHHRHERNQ